MVVSEYIKKRSENIAGIISLLGSTALVFGGSLHSIVAAGIFTAAELTLAKWGHKTAGYSAGAALFAAGDLTLAFSSSVQSGSFLQITLFGMAAAWTAGALKYPFEQAAKVNNFQKLQKIADTLPTICGSGNLLLRVPGIVSATHSGNYVVAFAISAWGVADILAGRLQEKVMPFYNRVIRSRQP